MSISSVQCPICLKDRNSKWIRWHVPNKGDAYPFVCAVGGC